jgi:hypothetical protein
MTSIWDDAAIRVAPWGPLTLEDYEAGACRQGCRHEECLGNGGEWLANGGYYVPWDCPHGSWLMEAKAPTDWTTYGEGYSVRVEWDAKETAAACVRWLEHRGEASFGDIVFLEDMRYYAAETPEQRASRKEALALRDAADEAKVIGCKVAAKEEKWTSKGAMKFRVPRPCRYATLFEKRICAGCSAQLPPGQNTCSAIVVRVEEQERRHDGRMAGTGKMVSRLAKPGDLGARPCGEILAGCWNHEQHRTCIYVHPDEPQWSAACAGTLRVKADNRLVFCMAGEEGGAAGPGPGGAGGAASRDFCNRFQALMGGGGQRGGQRQQGQQRGGSAAGGGGGQQGRRW